MVVRPTLCATRRQSLRTLVNAAGEGADGCNGSLRNRTLLAPAVLQMPTKIGTYFLWRVPIFVRTDAVSNWTHVPSRLLRPETKPDSTAFCFHWSRWTAQCFCWTTFKHARVMSEWETGKVLGTHDGFLHRWSEKKV